MTKKNSAFSLFHPKVKEWIYKKGWSDLTDAQISSAFAVIKDRASLVISAPTASGKTEAAFLPLVSQLISREKGSKKYIFYISPLKALINDQWQRLDTLCKTNRIDVIPWHGDISPSIKRRIGAAETAIVLITPESMEAMLINRSELAKILSPHIEAFVIDEFHAFVGQSRGDQLISLIERFTELSGKTIRRIALSATIGDKSAIASALHPKNPSQIQHIDSSQQGQTIKLRVRGFEPPILSLCEVNTDKANKLDETELRRREFTTYVASELFKYQNKTNLVFPNSRRMVEDIADEGNQLCSQKHMDRRFFAHHGFLSKEIREDIEMSARKGDKMMTICCTSTLELGIDLGSVDTVFQITAPSNVSTLRQRLGRSGRRGTPPALRTYICQANLEKIESSEQDSYLREELVRAIACLELIAENWYEPPDNVGISPSIAAHQILSLLAQMGGIHIAKIWLFFESTKAYRLSKDGFKNILHYLGKKGLIIQLSNGQITLSERGEGLTHSKDFYTVFCTPEEWSISTKGRIIARLPLSAERINLQDCLLLAGKRWSIAGINDEAKSVTVVPDRRKGSTPTSHSDVSPIHTRIRQKMKEIYCSDNYPMYLDEKAKFLLRQGRSNFHELGLDKSNLCIQAISQISWFPWVGTRTMTGLMLLIESFSGNSPTLNKGSLSLTCSREDLKKTCAAISSFSAEDIKHRLIKYFTKNRPGMFKSDDSKKWIWLIPDEIAGEEFIDDRVDISEAISSLKILEPSLVKSSQQIE